MRARLRAFWALLLREHTAPGRVAAAVLLGCAVGCTPLFGLHLPICLLLALLLRLNKLVVYGAANISIPPMVPILGLASVQIGSYLLEGRALVLAAADFRGAALRDTARRFFLSWMAGGLVLGTAIGLVAGMIVYAALRRRAAQAPRASDACDVISDAIGRAAERYRGLHPRFAWYARMKYRMDPCYRALAAEVPPGALLVDLGTGLGMLPVVVAELGEGRCAYGVEWDEAKAAAGAQAAAGLAGVTLVQDDLRRAALPACDRVALVDVLHYYDAAVQREILSRAASALRPGGALLIRDGDGERRGGAGFTRWIERAAVRLGWNRGPQVRFRTMAELGEDLRALGLSVTAAEVAGPLHPGNVLLIARRSADSAAAVAPVADAAAEVPRP